MFVTMDLDLPYQQNLKVLNLAVVVLRATSNASTHVAPLMPRVDETIRTAKLGRSVVVAA